MKRFIEVTSTQGLKVLINAHKIVSINESVNNQHTYVYFNGDFNGDDYIKVKETYEEIRKLIEDASQDNSKNSKAPEMLEILQYFVDNNMLSVTGEEMAKQLIERSNRTMKLTQTTDYLLLIDEEAEIKESDLFLGDNTRIRQCTFNNAGNISFKGGWYSGSSNCKKLIAYYPLTKDVQELDLPLLPNPFEGEVNIEKLAKQKYPITKGLR